MSEHQRETAFLRHIILYDDSDERRKLEKSIAQVQHNVRCVKSVVWVTVPVPVLVIVGAVYGAILHDNFPFNGAEFIFEVLCVIGLASLICLAGFVVLLTFYRHKLNQLRKACRQLVIKLLESHFGNPHIAASPSRHRTPNDGESSKDARGVGGYPGSPSLT